MNVADGVGYTRLEILVIVARVSFIAAFGFVGMKWLMNHLDPTNNAKKKARKKVIHYFFDIFKNYVLHNLCALHVRKVTLTFIHCPRNISNFNIKCSTGARTVTKIS